MPAEPALERLDTRLRELRGAAERIRESLVALEVDTDHELLERARLDGESARRWAAASAAITYLWHSLGLLDGLLDRAGRLRDARRLRADQLIELGDLLEGESIELTRTDVPLAERALLGGSAVTSRCSAAELLSRMSAAFDEAKTVVVRIGGAWETLVPRLDAVRRLSADTRRLAEELGEPARADLDAAVLRLDALGARLSTDPLSLAPAALDALAACIQAIRHDLDSTAALARELAVRTARAGELLEQVEAAVRDGVAAHDELIVKIAITAEAEAPPAPRPQLADELGAQLAEVADLARRGAWREARVALERWTAQASALLAEAQRIVSANRAPIEARNRLRGMLDAYQAKAKALGLLEDPRLADVFTRAREELYRAPTDLALVGQLVRRYQEELTGSRSARGMML